MSKSNLKIYIHHMPAIPYDPLGLKYDKAHEAHSFVVQFLNLLFTQLVYGGIATIDITGVSRAIYYSAYTLSGRANAGEVTRGIIVGTGSTPPQPSDYKIQTIIPHGNAAGQLAYSFWGESGPWIAPPNIYCAIHRTFTNNSGAPITVTEITLYAQANIGSTPYYFCITRDILAAPATIQAGQAYRFIITFCTPVG